jgi:cation diffusion facilitator CzcD-associated flavoprotein CzcO
MNGHTESGSPDLDFDVAIIGAAISGINSAYRIQTLAPKGTTYAILEARDDIGGTWDLFKYPGIRSDSDLHTFGFQWRPWNSRNAIATAGAIMDYLRECVSWAGIDKNIRFGTRLLSADWSSTSLCWTLNCEVDGKPTTFRARFIILGTGYYDYNEPLPAVIPGIENFKGQVVHPQFWPQDLDYTDKNMVIVGSGATAVTLLPNVANKAKHVTMLQRSPSYVLSLPTKDRLGSFFHAILPQSIASRLDFFRWLTTSYLLYKWCHAFPNAAKRWLKKETIKQLPQNIPWDPHFKPAYNPWDQRLCLCPGGDFYKALRGGKADVVTGHIKMVTEKTIEMESGERLTPDIIVTATGLKVMLAGGAKFFVDGKPIIVPDKFMWKGAMLEDLPNAAFVVGYTNASWTLGADATAHLVTRLLNTMQKKGAVAAVPRLKNPESMKSTPIFNLSSTYLVAAKSVMPKTGTGQWAPRTNYFTDIREAKRGDIETGLQFLKPAPVANGSAHSEAQDLI